jgi:hypothetical protein
VRAESRCAACRPPAGLEVAAGHRVGGTQAPGPTRARRWTSLAARMGCDVGTRDGVKSRREDVRLGMCRAPVFGPGPGLGRPPAYFIV